MRHFLHPEEKFLSRRPRRAETSAADSLKLFRRVLFEPTCVSVRKEEERPTDRKKKRTSRKREREIYIYIETYIYIYIERDIENIE